MTHSAATRPFEAAISVIGAMTLIGLIDNTIIYVAEIAGLWQFHFCRGLLAIGILLGVAKVAGIGLWPRRFGSVLLRSLLISASMLFYFGALAFLTVPETAAGLFAAPIIVLIISGLILKHPISAANVVAIICGFGGVLMVLQPEIGGMSWPKLMPFAAAVLYACGALVTRGMCVNENTLTLLFGFFVALTLWGAVGLLALSVWPLDPTPGADGFLSRGWLPITQEFVMWTTLQAVGSVIAVGLLTRAYLMAAAHFVAGFEYSVLITAAFWGWLFWGQVQSPLAWSGITLIIFSGLLLARSERLAKLQPTT